MKKKNNQPQNEIEQKIREHKRKKYRKIVIVVGILLVILIGAELLLALGNFQDFTVRSSVEQGSSSASSFAAFGDGVLDYTNDGILYMDADGNLIWNQAYEMNMPKISICGGYVVAYDQGGTDLYILTAEGLAGNFETGHPIRSVCMADQGTVGVLMREDGDAYVKLYDRSGNELTNGEFYAKEGKIPIDIALSPDATTLALDMVDITAGKVDTQLDFYNFGSAGQNEVNNLVASYTYEDTLIPEVEYLSSGTMAALTDTQIMIFAGTTKPELSKTIDLDEEADSVFYNSSYIGVVSATGDAENTHMIRVYNLKGKMVMEHDTTMAYTDAYFLNNNEICITGNYQCELYTIHSIKKFSYTFDGQLYTVLYAGSLNNYIIIRDGLFEQVRLK